MTREAGGMGCKRSVNRHLSDRDQNSRRLESDRRKQGDSQQEMDKEQNSPEHCAGKEICDRVHDIPPYVIPRQYSRTASEYYELTTTTGSAHEPDGSCLVAARHATARRAMAQCAEMRFWPRQRAPVLPLIQRQLRQRPLIQFKSASRIHGTRARAGSSMHRRAPFVTTDRGSTADRRQNLPPQVNNGRRVWDADKSRELRAAISVGDGTASPLKRGNGRDFPQPPHGVIAGTP